jgi:hypothetical protein
VFRYENEKVERKVRRRASDASLAMSASSSRESTSSTHSPGLSDRDGTRRTDSISLSDLSLQNPRPWLKDAVASSTLSADEQAVSSFFEKFVMYPCNRGSSGGFLEYLPCMFEEINTQNRVALRWAVRAAAYANLSKEQNDALERKASQCYGLALSALAKAVAKNKDPPDDYILMTVVVLDLFEVSLDI